MSWLSKLMPSGIRTQAGTQKNKRSVPEGLWEKCERCGSVLYRPELEENLEVCPKCNFHMAIRARARLRALFDAGETVEIGAGLGRGRYRCPLARLGLPGAAARGAGRLTHRTAVHGRLS